MRGSPEVEAILRDVVSDYWVITGNSLHSITRHLFLQQFKSDIKHCLTKVYSKELFISVMNWFCKTISKLSFYNTYLLAKWAMIDKNVWIEFCDLRPGSDWAPNFDTDPVVYRSLIPTVQVARVRA